MASADVKATPSPRTILVVEDNDNDAALIRLLFRRSRILNPLQIVASVEEATSYLKGIVPFADRQVFPFPVLIMVDSHLPDGSGFDILRWLHVHKPEAPLVVIMLTGSDLHASRISYELGAQSFLSKPLKFEEFENMIQRVRGIKLTTTAEGHIVEPQ